MRPRLLQLSLCLSVALSVPTTGAQQPVPTFRAGVDLVPVDVTVLDRQGRPVSDLTAADFTLRVDGQPRTVVSASYIATRRVDDAAPDRQTFSTNAGQRPGRLIALVIDEANIRRGSARSTLSAAAAFVKSLDRADRVALYLIPGAGPVSGFTSNHALVLRLLERAAGQATEGEFSGKVGVAEALEILERPPDPDRPTGVTPGSLLEAVLGRECAGEHDPTTMTECRRMIEAEARSVLTQTRGRTTRSLVALRGVMDHLAASPASKTLVLLTEGLVLGREINTRWIAPLAAKAQVTMYALRLDGSLFDASGPRVSPSRGLDRDLMIEGLDQLVGAADGTVFPVAVNAASVFSRLDLELSGYYLLSFAPLPGDRNGKPHEITVRTTRKDVLLRSRREFSMAAEVPRTRQDFLLDALKSPLGLTDFNLHATTYHYQDIASGRLKILVAVTLDRAFNPGGDFSLAWYVTDTQGKVVSIQDEQKITLPAGATPGRPQTFAGAVVLDPGVYSLTVAAADDAGRRATVEHGFEAAIKAVGQLRQSDLLVADAPAAGRTISPSVDGRITSNTLVAYAELYSAAEPQLQNATLTLEVARDETSRALESAPMRVVGTETKGQRSFEAGVPVSLLPDGNYVARTVLASGGRPIGGTVRAFTLARGAARPASAAAPAAPSAPPFAVRIDPFSRADVLTRPAVGFFLDRLQPAGLPALPDALIPALGLTRAGRFTEARAIVERAGVTHYAAPFFVGLAALAAGDLDQAAQQFGASLAAAPEFLPAAYYLGACYATAGRDREAIIAWRSGLIADTRAPWIYTTLVDALLRTRDLVPALELLADASSRWPESDDIRVRLGTAQAMSGQPAEAVRTLDPYLTRQPADHERLLLALRMLFEARSLGKAVDSVPADRERFARYAAAYQQAGGKELETVAAWKKVMDQSYGGPGL
jgi:VWFA-related protein